MRLECRLEYETEGRRMHAHACRLRPSENFFGLVWSQFHSILGVISWRCSTSDKMAILQIYPPTVFYVKVSNSEVELYDSVLSKKMDNYPKLKLWMFGLIAFKMYKNCLNWGERSNGYLTYICRLLQRLESLKDSTRLSDNMSQVGAIHFPLFWLFFHLSMFFFYITM